MGTTSADADVIVVGAGPGGSACAYHLAKHGARVLLLEKSEFPREKVCGDGLTPRGVKQVVAMGIDTTTPGWTRNRGLRVIGGGQEWLLPVDDAGQTRLLVTERAAARGKPAPRPPL